ncbi:PGPGW domain-containing protein [Thalassotalea profundi]|uniref:Integral membrane protein n=1 Tax=Thalassotalea profundi TaxID=2036687 RepID=A0ABQ3IZH7_9GAMM|nr:PGPGW domain-containing protein [Thalassotalea profundi]GHE99387.1 integral membrane protein [Thalassotalea profundi]
MNNVKRLVITVLGGILVLMGVVFILLPGPAIIFLPLGLALLSLEFNWAKRWLKSCQRWMRKSAVQMDKFIAKRRYSTRNN